jgi:hypothetical protein
MAAATDLTSALSAVHQSSSPIVLGQPWSAPSQAQIAVAASRDRAAVRTIYRAPHLSSWNPASTCHRSSPNNHHRRRRHRLPNERGRAALCSTVEFLLWQSMLSACRRRLLLAARASAPVCLAAGAISSRSSPVMHPGRPRGLKQDSGRPWPCEQSVQARNSLMCIVRIYFSLEVSVFLVNPI